MQHRREFKHHSDRHGLRAMRVGSLSSDGRVPEPEALSVSQHTSGTKKADYSAFDIPQNTNFARQSIDVGNNRILNDDSGFGNIIQTPAIKKEGRFDVEYSLTEGIQLSELSDSKNTWTTDRKPERKKRA